MALLTVPALFTVPVTVVTPYCTLNTLVNPPFAFALILNVPAILPVTPAIFAKARVKASVVRDVSDNVQPLATLISSPVLFTFPAVRVVPPATDCRVTEVFVPLTINCPIVCVVGTLVIVPEGLLVNLIISLFTIFPEYRFGFQFVATV